MAIAYLVFLIHIRITHHLLIHQSLLISTRKYFSTDLGLTKHACESGTRLLNSALKLLNFQPLADF